MNDYKILNEKIEKLKNTNNNINNNNDFITITEDSYRVLYN